MASDTLAGLRRAATPFLAGAAAATAFLDGLYATATLGVFVGLWAAALVHQAVARRAAPATAPQPLVRRDGKERRLTQYLDLSPAPLVALDARDRLSVVNRAARRLLGAGDRVANPPAGLAETIADTPPGRAATVRIDAGEGTRAFAILTADVDAADGPTRIAALVDIDADLKAAEAATLRDLIQVLSHEITNTLTPIASLSATAASMMADVTVDLPAARAAIETVARRADGLQRFGAAYRDLARLPPPTSAPADLGRVATDLAQLFESRWPEIGLRMAVTPPMLVVRLDADQIAQALWALLQNAAEVAREVELEIEGQASIIRFLVRDNGPGVPMANADAIFRPFFTTKQTGSGVGLALARQIFRGHGGDLSLDLGVTDRTMFQAVLPR